MTERSLGVGNAQVSFAVAGFFEVWHSKAAQGSDAPSPNNILPIFNDRTGLFEA